MESDSESPVKYAPYNRKKDVKLTRRAKLLARSFGRMSAKNYKKMLEYSSKRAKTRNTRKPTYATVRRSTRTVKAPAKYSPPKITRAVTAKKSAKKLTVKQESNLSDIFSRFTF
jgi:hypothetical protein